MVQSIVWDRLHKEFLQHCCYRDLSERSVAAYKSRTGQFIRWALIPGNVPDDLNEIKAKHIEAYLYYRKVEAQIAQNTRSVDYVALVLFFTWMKKEKHIKKNPTKKVTPVHQEDVPVIFPEEKDIRKLIDSCNETFVETRTRLALTLIKETGLRAFEALAIEIEHIDEANRLIRIPYSKGGFERTVPYGDETALALCQYLIVRKSHRYAELPYLFIGQRGHIKYNALRASVIKQAEIAEIDHMRCHWLRHFFVHTWKENDGSSDGLDEIAGWKNGSKMQARYARALRKQRALKEYQRKMTSNKKDE